MSDILEYNTMRELTKNEVQEVSGGRWQIAVAAAVYKEAYETATFFGAGSAGRWIGAKVYSIFH